MQLCYHAGLMRALVAALILTFAIAVTASVFAIWPVVADAPWEDDVSVPVAVDNTEEILCEGALRLRESAAEGLGNVTFRAAWRALEDQLERAQREIDRYC